VIKGLFSRKIKKFKHIKGINSGCKNELYREPDLRFSGTKKSLRRNNPKTEINRRTNQ
jgi:hypothetical protein